MQAKPNDLSGVVGENQTVELRFSRVGKMPGQPGEIMVKGSPALGQKERGTLRGQTQCYLFAT